MSDPKGTSEKLQAFIQSFGNALVEVRNPVLAQIDWQRTEIQAIARLCDMDMAIIENLFLQVIEVAQTNQVGVNKLELDLLARIAAMMKRGDRLDQIRDWLNNCPKEYHDQTWREAFGFRNYPGGPGAYFKD